MAADLMAVFHTQPSEIDKLDWERLCWMHAKAVEFYMRDREAQIRGTVAALWGTSDGGN
jgi:hypothetical protein